MPRKLGQHFLVREAILQSLTSAICGKHTERVVEIGAGRGALTRHLVPFTDELHALELDSSLVLHLDRVFAGEPKVHVHHADVLATDLSQWGPAVIAGNLPYYITSPIIDRFLNLGPGFPTAVFLMQYEVAQRLLAAPGSRDYGYLTVATQLVCNVELVCHVPPGAFAPPPKVDSAGVRLSRKPTVAADLPSVLKLASRAFAHKRKTLRNNLRSFYGPAVDALPEAALRAEQISIDRFLSLHARLSGSSTLLQ